MSNQPAVIVERPKDVVRQAQVVKVITLMTEKHMTQAEACALVGISERTFQRWANKPDFVPVIKQMAVDALNAAALVAIGNLPHVVEDQAKTARGEQGDIRDRNKSAVFIRDIVKEFAQVGGTPKSVPGALDMDEDGSATVTVTFKPGFANKKIETDVTVQEPPVVIEGTVTQS